MTEGVFVLIRTLVLFGLLLLVIPLLGRKPMIGNNFFNDIVGFVAAVMVALIVLNIVKNFLLGITVLATWLLAIAILQFVAKKSKWLRDHFYGKEVTVIKEGKILEENLSNAKMTGEDLLSQLRRKNIFKVADVEFAIMETNGDLSVLPKRDSLPVSPKDLNIKIGNIKEPHTVILNGKVLDEELKKAGLNRIWLNTELLKTGVALDNIFIGQVDGIGDFYVDLFDDTLEQPVQTVKEQLLATLEKIEADFLTYSLETDNKYWKKRYQEMSKEIQNIYTNLEPYLKK